MKTTMLLLILVGGLLPIVGSLVSASRQRVRASTGEPATAPRAHARALVR